MNKKIYIIIGVVLLVALLSFGAFMIGRQTSKSSVSNTPTPTETQTPLLTTPEISPTETATPSPTLKPTSTPKPTLTPSATPTITPTPTPAVINIETTVSPAGTTTTCSQQTFTFTGKIYTNAATTVKYMWLRSDNANSAEQTLTFTSAGMQSVTDTWSMSRSSGTHYSGWERVKIISPNETLGNQAEFTLACP